MEAKSTFVQIMRSLPPNSSSQDGRFDSIAVADAAATTKNDAVMVRKGIRAMELLDTICRSCGIVDQRRSLRPASRRNRARARASRLAEGESPRGDQEAGRSLRDDPRPQHYLVGQLETYKSYLHNVRSQSEGVKKRGSIKELGPYKFTHQQLEKEGVIQKSNVPENRRANIYFIFTSPIPGTFVISLHYKGRNRGLLELDLKLDDLLEMQKEKQEDLDLEYVQFNVSKVLTLLNKRFARKRGW